MSTKIVEKTIKIVKNKKKPNEMHKEKNEKPQNKRKSDMLFDIAQADIIQ